VAYGAWMAGILLGPLEMLWKYIPMRPSNTPRSRRTRTLFDGGGPTWAQNSGLWAVKLQDSYREVQGIRLQWTWWLLIGVLTLGDLGCLGGSSGGPVLGSLFTEGDKERPEWTAGICSGKCVYRMRQRKTRMGIYLCMGPFILSLNPFYG
jgi:hypothetical protein